MRTLVCAFALIFSGFILDIGCCTGWITEAQWFEHYFTFRDIQTVGFALFAFAICPYSRTELKVAAFSMLIWRVLVLIINIVDMNTVLSWSFIYGSLALYLAWMLKAWLMGEYQRSKPEPGMYKIFFPIHSVWGLLQAVFLPWHPARYESRMISDGKHVWCVNKKEFMKYEVSTPKNLDHVKVYMGRQMTYEENRTLDNMVGNPVYPGISDCRKLMIV